jgi:hypothetical protein
VRHELAELLCRYDLTRGTFPARAAGSTVTRLALASRMDTQELDDELGNPGAQALLRSSSLCHLAYLGPDGLPRVIPVGFY